MSALDDAIKDRLRLMLSRNLSSQEEERRRIARDLHDHLGQELTGLHLQLEGLHHAARSRDPDLADGIARVQALARRIDRDLHAVTADLRSSVLEHVGLPAALTDLVASFTTSHNIPALIDVIGFANGRLQADIEVHLYRVAQEALNNARKHAQASSLEVVLQQSAGRVVLSVVDDGVGFSDDAALGRPIEQGLGLLGMRERAALIGGTLQIETMEGQGTSVILSAPIVVAS